MTSRGRVRKKYTVDRSCGPLVLCAELLLKRLIQHCWPCDYEAYRPPGDTVESAFFGPLKGRKLGPDFFDAFEIAVRVLSSETGARIGYTEGRIWLEGPHYIGTDGYPRYGVPKKHRQEESDLGIIIRQSGPVRDAILHCAAVPSDWHKGHTAQSAVDEVRRWHRRKGWADIGYHYVIVPDGSYALGRDLERDGAHCSGHNAGTLGILLVERQRIERIGKFEQYFTVEQKATVKRLLARHQIVNVTGHNVYANKLCPGFYVRTSDWVQPNMLPNK